jgi:hypothetical protein
MFCDVTECHHTPTMMWQHSWIGSCLTDGSAKHVLFLNSNTSKTDHSWLFPVGLCERLRLCSANAHSLEWFKQSTKKSTSMHWAAFTVKCLEQTQISSDEGRQTELILYLYRIIYRYIKKLWIALHIRVCPNTHTHTHTHVHVYHGSWNSVLGTVTQLQMIKLRKIGSIHCKSQKFFSFPKHSDWFWGLTIPLINGYQGLFSPV